MNDLLLNDWMFFGVLLPVTVLAAAGIGNAPLIYETWCMHKRTYRVAGVRAFFRFMGHVVCGTTPSTEEKGQR